MTRTHYLKSAVLGLLIVAILFTTYACMREWRRGVLTVATIGADSIYIDGPTGNHVLINGGSDSKILTVLNNLLPFYDNAIDLIIDTQTGHLYERGLVTVINSYNVTGLLYASTTIADADTFNFLNTVKTAGLMTIEAKASQMIDLGGGATLEIISIEPSLTMRLTYNKTQLVLPLESSATSTGTRLFHYSL